MGKFKTTDGVEVTAKKSTNDSGHDVWTITFPDGTVKEMLDTLPQDGSKVFAANFKEVK